MYPNSGYPPHQGGGFPPQQGGFPPQQPGGYPPQQGGYPPQQGGYPPQQGGYPPQQGGYPPQQSGGYPQPGGYPPQQPSYPGQSVQPDIGFGGMPSEPAYPSYPDHSGPQSGYPGQSGPPGGYPGAQSGYPGPPGGYPGAQSGYPGQSGPPGGYPGAQSGYTGQSGPPGGYPGAQSGYPGQSGPPGGYPGAQSGYTGQSGPPGGYPGQSGPPQGYPPQQPGGYPGQPDLQNNSQYPPFEQNRQPPAPQSQPEWAQNPSLYPHLPAAGAGAGGSQFMQSFDSSSKNKISGSGSYYSQQPSYEAVVKTWSPFDPNDDAGKLYKAMKGFGTNEAVIIDVLCKRTSTQRKEIEMAYKSGYGKDLQKNLKSELGGKFEDLALALMFTRAQLEAYDLKKAIDGMGTDEDSLIDILCTKTNSEMHELKDAYKHMFKKDLEKDVGGDVSGYFKRFLVSLSAGFRSDAPPDHDKAINQAKELYSAGAKSMGTDEVKFNRIFAVESFPHLKLVFEEYQKLTGKPIESAIKSEMSGSVEEAFLAVAAMAKYPPTYFAKRLNETMKGAGTKDKALIRNMVLRSEIDMVNVKQEFQRIYGKSLENSIKSDCSGDYKRGLLCLAGDPGWR